MNNAKASKLLKDNKISITTNRVQVLIHLADSHHFHSVSEIIEHSEGTLNKKSVYNAIKIFINNGIIDVLSFGGVPKYALSDNLSGNSEIHVVSKDGKIEHIDIDKKIFNQIRKSVKGSDVKNINITVLKK